MYRFFLLFTLLIGISISVPVTHASSGGVDSRGCIQSGSVSTDRCMVRTHIRDTRTHIRDRQMMNKSLRATNSGTMTEFRMNNSGTIRDTVQSLTGVATNTQHIIRIDRKKLIHTHSGRTVEEKLIARPQLEDKARSLIETRYKNNTELLGKRLAVYDENKIRRDMIATNQLTSLLDHSSIRASQVSLFVKSVEAKLDTLTVEQKKQIGKKIDEQILKINTSKLITAELKTSMVGELTTLKAKL